MMVQNSSADLYAVRLRISVCLCCAQPIHRVDLYQACKEGTVCIATIALTLAGGRVLCIHHLIAALTRSKYPDRYLPVPDLLKCMSRPFLSEIFITLPHSIMAPLRSRGCRSATQRARSTLALDQWRQEQCNATVMEQSLGLPKAQLSRSLQSYSALNHRQANCTRRPRTRRISSDTGGMAHTKHSVRCGNCFQCFDILIQSPRQQARSMPHT